MRCIIKTANPTTLDFSILPEQARQELTDFYQFLKNKYRPSKAGQKAAVATPSQELADGGFVGMWKDRTDMKDAAGWVMEQRASACADKATASKLARFAGAWVGEPVVREVSP